MRDVRDPLSDAEAFLEENGRLHDATVLALSVTQAEMELRVDDLFKALVGEAEYPGRTPGSMIFHNPRGVSLHDLPIEAKVAVFDMRVIADGAGGGFHLKVEFSPGGLLTANCASVGVVRGERRG